ncbi:MAG: hypothetical protein JNL36_02555 [Candidatus Kapabacteria bacterium]|nr:hypothetical protein [Candidatus Kapabacteria bacterium]
MKKFLLFGLVLLSSISLFSQVEHTPIYHPVYTFLTRMEVRGFLGHTSLTQLPLQRKQVIDALISIQKNSTDLSEMERNTLVRFLREFRVIERKNATVFPSQSDSLQVLSTEMFDESAEKLVFFFADTSTMISIYPLVSLEPISVKAANESDNLSGVLGQIGARIHGSIGDNFGYFLQTTNGTVLQGDRNVALEIPRLSQNIKFTKFNSDFDFTESHIRFQKDWFYGIIGRENRLVGAGYLQRTFLSDNAPPMDAIQVGATFEKFEYRFTHASLLGIPVGSVSAGFSTVIPPKYLAMSRFSYRPTWGEFSFVQSTLYSQRNFDLAYINPLTFLKSVEHSLRDRDNSMLGFDATIRPLNRIQIRASFLMDDISFSTLNTDWWHNKFSSTVGVLYATPFGSDIVVEYTRNSPYVFTHFNVQNSMTNDGIAFSGYVPPNSDILSFQTVNWWLGNRYPITLTASYQRYGKNVFDSTGALVFNAGGDVLQTRRPFDSEFVKFLEGDVQKILTFQGSIGYEIIRGFSLHTVVKAQSVNDETRLTGQLIFRFEDF